MITSLLQAAFIGTVQGVTEFLPVSSTGHLLILSQILKLDHEKFGLTLVLFTNIATTLAAIWYFKSDLGSLLRTLFHSIGNKRFSPNNSSESTPFWIAGVTALVGIAGLLFTDALDRVETLPVIATSLILFGLVMLFAEKYSLTKKKYSELTLVSAYAVGLSQIIAFIPGVSRSGITISTGLFMGLNRVVAARYSFLLSIPVISIAVLKQMVSEREMLIGIFSNGNDAAFYVVAFIFTLVTAYWSISALLKYLQHASLASFAYYRLALGVSILLYLCITRA